MWIETHPNLVHFWSVCQSRKFLWILALWGEAESIEGFPQKTRDALLQVIGTSNTLLRQRISRWMNNNSKSYISVKKCSTLPFMQKIFDQILFLMIFFCFCNLSRYIHGTSAVLLASNQALFFTSSIELWRCFWQISLGTLVKVPEVYPKKDWFFCIQIYLVI